MPALRARPYTAADAGRWDALVDGAVNGTVMHRRSWLQWCDARFADRSLVVEDRGGRLVGVLPAARHPGDAGMVESHPGASHGGLVHAGALRGPRMLEALEAVADRLYHDGHRILRYTPVPSVHQRVPASDDRYALFRLAAVRSRCDLVDVVPLAPPEPTSARRRRDVARAERAGVRVTWDAERLAEVVDLLARPHRDGRHEASLHGPEDLRRLIAANAGAVECVAGLLGGDVAAGAVVFRTGRVEQVQYMGADARGRRAGALDLVVDRVIARAGARGAAYLSFGSSTLFGGSVLMEGVHAYKAKFGGGGVVRETYDLELA